MASDPTEDIFARLAAGGTNFNSPMGESVKQELYFFEEALSKAGLNTPFRRCLFGTTLTSGLLWAIKPSFAFGPDGQPRTWSLVSSPDEDQTDSSTPVPWWTVSIFAGYVMGVLL